MKQRIMHFIGALLGILSLGVVRPNENERSTFLMHDHKADGPTSYPGGLLTGLFGVKEGEDLENVARRLHEKFEGIKGEIKDDLQKDIRKLESDWNQKLAAQSGGGGGVQGTKERIEAAERALVAHYMRTGTISGEKARELANLSGKKATDFTVVDNAFVVPEFIDKLIVQIIKSNSTLLDRVHIASAGAGYNRVMMRGGSSGWAAETTVRAQHDAPSAFNTPYTGGELYYRFQVSQWAVDDAGYDLSGELMNSAGEEFARQLEKAVIAGAGGTEPTGLNQITSALVPAFGQLRRVEQGAALGYDDLIATVLSVPKRYRAGSTWIVRPTTLSTIINLKDANNKLIFEPGLNDQDTGRLLGYPVEESEDVESNRVAYFGNLQRGYSIHFITGTRIVRDPFTRKGYVEFYVSRRVRGAASDTTGLSTLVDLGQS